MHGKRKHTIKIMLKMRNDVEQINENSNNKRFIFEIFQFNNGIILI